MRTHLFLIGVFRYEQHRRRCIPTLMGGYVVRLYNCVRMQIAAVMQQDISVFATSYGIMNSRF